MAGEQPVHLEAQVAVGAREVFLCAVLEHHVLSEVAARVELPAALLGTKYGAFFIGHAKRVLRCIS